MIRYILNFLLFFLILIIDNPVFSHEFSNMSIENYTLKVSRKFTKTFCNTTKFGIARDSALKFSIGETKKEFLNNKLNKYINYKLLNKNIISSLDKNCQIDDLTIDELENLVFK